eukprot:scaffold149861_cov29-Tisochrysis_lutea.AAC.3
MLALSSVALAQTAQLVSHGAPGHTLACWHRLPCAPVAAEVPSDRSLSLSPSIPASASACLNGQSPLVWTSSGCM